MFLNCLLQKEESSIHNIIFFSEEVVLSESGEKYAQIKHCLQAKTIQTSYELLILIWKDNGNFFSGWNYYELVFWPGVML